jgi:two-component system, cell cycle response regulator
MRRFILKVLYFLKKVKKILLVEGSAQEVDFIKICLPSDKGFKIEVVNSLEAAVKKIYENKYDCILIDSFLDEEYVLSTVERIIAKTSRIPIIVISDVDDDKMALKAIRKGAHDYFIKKNINERNLSRCIKHSIERYKVITGLYDIAFMDELTGLYNRRGFLLVARQQMEMSRRNKKGFVIVYADLNGLKLINDIHGHDAGDKALVSISEILFSSFRCTDIIARLGGDEFAVIALNTVIGFEKKIGILLNEKIAEFNKWNKGSYVLSCSFGIVRVTGENMFSLRELLSQADNLMYEAKKIAKNKKLKLKT